MSSLEMFSLISPVVCRRMVEEKAVPVLFKLLTTCNRSAPHLKIVSHALRVLLNIGRCSSPRVGGWCCAQHSPCPCVLKRRMAPA